MADVSKEKAIDLDYVLVNELGQFGWYQFRYICLIALPIMSSAFFSDYVFTSAKVPHRCRIPECGEMNKSALFKPEWISNAIPITESELASCERYAVNPGNNGTLDVCPVDIFNRSNIVQCEEFVYENNLSVVYEFDLGCQEWLRSLSGTLSSLGTLLVLPFIGYISDRFGRKNALLISIANTAICGVIKAFSPNYTMFLIFQLLETTLGGGLFSSAYIFVTELVGPKYRVVASATASSMFATGQVILGAVAWVVQPWKLLILTIHVPVFLLLSYHWILSESIRWLLSKKRYEDARKVLEKIAKVNGKQISDKSIHGLMNPSEIVKDNKHSLIKSILRSPVLLRRVCTTPIWWITSTFTYYGLSINSTSLSETIYLNYILTVAIEIPGFYTAVLTLDKFGRKPTLCTGFFASAICNLAFVFISKDLTTIRLIIYLAGKFGISLVFTSLYLYTSELYPTEFRHSLLGFSSMVGRIGSVCAPMTPLLAEYFWSGLTNTLFAVLGLIAGLLVLTQPETVGNKLPDTLEEAEAI